MIKLLAGARLSPGGLHMGHYIGNFLPYHDFEGSKEYCFVIKDTEPILWASKKEKEKVLVGMASDVLSLPFSNSIKVTTTSRIHPHAYDLNSLLLDEISYSTLISTHFKKNDFRSGKTTQSVKNFLFPIDEVLTLLSLNTDFFVSNDDNKRIELFCRDVAKKLNKKLQMDAFKIVSLKSNKNVSRLLGCDYKRMCKANSNIIGFNEPENDLLSKLRTITSRRYFFNAYPEELEKSQEQVENYALPPHYLPFVLLSIFLDAQISEEERRIYSEANSRDLLVEHLFNAVNSHFKITRDKKAELLLDPNGIIRRIENDSLELGETIEKFLQPIKDNLV